MVRNQIGQLLIIGFDDAEMSPRLASLLSTIQPAGVILFARNIRNAAQTHALLRECQKCVATPLFTCVDLEGGTVDRFRNAIGPTPSAADVFAAEVLSTKARKLFRRHGRIIGENCRALGFNVDFAPALDLAFEASKSVMSSRSVSADPKQVVAYAREFLRGLADAKVLGCGKHFPGLGEANLDSHHHLPVIHKSLKKMWNEDLAPYRTLRRELPMVMISHAAFPAIASEPVLRSSFEGDGLPGRPKAHAKTDGALAPEGLTPASLSRKWITEILRAKIGYRGLICSDDLEMGGVLAAAPIEQAAIAHIRAGGDLALICHQEDLIRRAYEALTREAERDRHFAKCVQESVRRVLAFKKKHLAQTRTQPPSSTKIGKLTRQLWEFGEEIRLESLDHAMPQNKDEEKNNDKAAEPGA